MSKSVSTQEGHGQDGRVKDMKKSKGGKFRKGRKQPTESTLFDRIASTLAGHEQRREASTIKDSARKIQEVFDGLDLTERTLDYVSGNLAEAAAQFNTRCEWRAAGIDEPEELIKVVLGILLQTYKEWASENGVIIDSKEEEDPSGSEGERESEAEVTEEDFLKHYRKDVIEEATMALGVKTFISAMSGRGFRYFATLIIILLGGPDESSYTREFLDRNLEDCVYLGEPKYNKILATASHPALKELNLGGYSPFAGLVVAFFKDLGLPVWDIENFSALSRISAWGPRDAPPKMYFSTRGEQRSTKKVTVVASWWPLKKATVRRATLAREIALMGILVSNPQKYGFVPVASEAIKAFLEVFPEMGEVIPDLTETITVEGEDGKTSETVVLSPMGRQVMLTVNMLSSTMRNRCRRKDLPNGALTRSYADLLAEMLAGTRLGDRYAELVNGHIRNFFWACIIHVMDKSLSRGVYDHVVQLTAAYHDAMSRSGETSKPDTQKANEAAALVVLNYMKSYAVGPLADLGRKLFEDVAACLKATIESIAPDSASTRSRSKPRKFHGKSSGKKPAKTAARVLKEKEAFTMKEADYPSLGGSTPKLGGSTPKLGGTTIPRPVVWGAKPKVTPAGDGDVAKAVVRT